MTEWRLDNQRFVADIRAQGGELVRLWNRQQNAERLWQATAGVWNNSATQLFPVVGRLVHQGLWQDEAFYPLPAHGFLREQTFRCIAQSPDSLMLEASATPETLRFWPWQWRVRLHFQLHPDGLSLEQQVFNDDCRMFYYSIGWHPGFALPMSKPGWQVEFSGPAVRGPFDTVNRTLTIPAASREISVFPLSATCFQSGAVYFGDCQHRQITVRSPDGSAVMTLETGEQQWLALWGVPGADVLCIEPLAGTTDDPDFKGQARNKRGIQSLCPGACQTFKSRLRFAVDE